MGIARRQSAIAGTPFLRACTDYRSGKVGGLSRLLTYASKSQHLEELQRLAEEAPSPAFRVAITGSAGVGKSSLIARIVRHTEASGAKIAVLACDPRSPLSGGALLGDRIRIQTRIPEAVYVRSFSTGTLDHTIPDNMELILRLIDGFGFSLTLVETAGAGQTDSAIRHFVDRVVVLVQPDAGDAMQWEKAGILEIADIIVLNKCDMPGARAVASHLRACLNIVGDSQTPILPVSSVDDSGIGALLTQIGLTDSSCE